MGFPRCSKKTGKQNLLTNVNHQPLRELGNLKCSQFRPYFKAKMQYQKLGIDSNLN